MKTCTTQTNLQHALKGILIIACLALPTLSSAQSEVTASDLLSFDASMNGEEQVDLLWTMDTATSADHFILQRSQDGITYADFGVLNASRNTFQINDYAALDPNPLEGMNHYRLRMVYEDGTSALSSEVDIEVVKKPKAGMQIINAYPNPISDQGTLVIKADLDAEATVSIVNTVGQLVVSNSISLQKGMNNVPLNFSELAKGMYTLKVQTGDNLFVDHRSVIRAY